MPRPTSGTELQRPDLGALAYEYLEEGSRQGLIGLRMAPLFGSKLKQSDYPIIPIEAVLKLPETKRAPDGSYPRSSWEWTTGTFNCTENGWEEKVDDVEAKLYENYFDVEVVTTARAVGIILRRQEKRIADMIFNTGNLSNSAIGTEWSTPSTATPRADIYTGKKNMKAASGLKPNAIVMSETVFNNALMTAEITDAFTYTNPIELGGFEVQKRILAQYFGVGQILVGDAIYDSANKGQSVSITDFWDDEYLALLRIAENPKDLKEPSIARTFLWEEDSPDNLVVETYRDDKVRGDIVRVRHHTNEVFVYTGAGYLLTNMTA